MDSFKSTVRINSDDLIDGLIEESNEDIIAFIMKIDNDIADWDFTAELYKALLKQVIKGREAVPEQFADIDGWEPGHGSDRKLAVPADRRQATKIFETTADNDAAMLSELIEHPRERRWYG